MYKAAVRAMIRHGLARLNAGDPSFLLRLAAPDAELAFPGDNTWASMFRPVHKGRERHATHRGLEECKAFAERFAQAGLTYQIEDILVNGPPWHLRPQCERPTMRTDRTAIRSTRTVSCRSSRCVGAA